jgi:hypothetical protein
MADARPLGECGGTPQGPLNPAAPAAPTLASLPESREKNRLGARNRRSHHQQRQPNQSLTKQTPGAVRDGSEGGRSASEGASRDGDSWTRRPPGQRRHRHSVIAFPAFDAQVSLLRVVLLITPALAANRGTSSPVSPLFSREKQGKIATEPT